MFHYIAILIQMHVCEPGAKRRRVKLVYKVAGVRYLHPLCKHCHSILAIVSATSPSRFRSFGAQGHIEYTWPCNSLRAKLNQLTYMRRGSKIFGVVFFLFLCIFL